MAIENIHVMRNSQQKMLEGKYTTTPTHFLTLTLRLIIQQETAVYLLEMFHHASGTRFFLHCLFQVGRFFT